MATVTPTTESAPPGRAGADPSWPDLTTEDVARLLRWHDEALRAARAEAGATGQHVRHLGRVFAVPPTVHPVTDMSGLLGRAVLAAGTADDVVAVDVNPDAVAAARGTPRPTRWPTG